MKILYHHRIASKDGQFVHIEEIINSLRKQGHIVRVVSPSVNDDQEFGGEGGYVANLKAKLPQALYEIIEFSYAFVAFFKLLFQALLFKPDGIYERFNLFLPSGIWVSKLLNIPLILEVNSPLYEERLKFDGLALRKLARWTQSYVLTEADKVLPVTQVLSDTLSEFIANEGKRLNPDKVVVIPNGINTEKFLVETKPATLPTSFNGCIVIGFVGFCREWHGLDLVVDILSELENSQVALLIVGDGPAIPNLVKQAEALGLRDRIHFTGIIGRDEMPAWVEAIDIALQPSVVPYASPLKLLEYMAKGKAIVAPSQANIKELVTNEKSALLFSANDKNAFKMAIKNLCESAELRNEIGQNAFNEVKKRPLTWDANASKICSLFESLKSGTELR